MDGPVGGALGTVASLWRYPVKSMQGEQLADSEVLDSGLLGDRAFALYDIETGKLASAKSPRRWPNLLDLRAAFTEPPVRGRPLPPVEITLPDGETIRTDDPAVDDLLSRATGRPVRLVNSNPDGATLEQYIPPVDGADPGGSDFYRDVPNDVFGTGALYDAAPVHLLTTATLDRLGELYPEGSFDAASGRTSSCPPTQEPASWRTGGRSTRWCSARWGSGSPFRPCGA